MLYMFYSNFDTDFRTAYKHKLIPSYVIINGTGTPQN